jgi:RES domain-containing protein
MVCRDLPQLRALTEFAEDESFQKEWAEVKLAAKVKAAAFLEQLCDIVVLPTSLFDVQVCRLLCAQHHIMLSLASRCWLSPSWLGTILIPCWDWLSNETCENGLNF